MRENARALRYSQRDLIELGQERAVFKRILVPVDGTPGSERAVPYALGVAQALDAEVVVCHVLTTPVTANSSAEEREADAYVSRIADRFGAAGVPAKMMVRRGDAPLEINKAAHEWNVDAIVMATRGRQRLQKLVLGSVADALVRESKLPVLLVSARSKESDEKVA
jgi:nucleotide-binding universal stress UspA family protein